MPRPPAPFFAGILYALGVLALVSALFFILMGVSVARTMSVETLATTGLFEAFAPAFGLMVCAAVLIGLSQMLTFVARIAFYAELLASQQRDLTPPRVFATPPESLPNSVSPTG